MDQNTPFIYKCKQCEERNSIEAQWFNDTVEKKAHNCKKCGNTINIIIAIVRERKKYDFKKKTQIIKKGYEFSEVESFQLRIVTENNFTPKSFFIEKNIVEIGRGVPTASNVERNMEGKVIQRINIQDKYISSNHCIIRIIAKDGRKRIIIKDIGSTNRTFVNENELAKNEEVYIKIGDKIKIGITDLEIL